MARSEASIKRNRERSRKYQREWRKLNPGRNAKMIAIWRRKNPAVAIIKSVRYRAKLSGIECTITDEQAKSLWTGVCAITGIRFKHSNPANPLSPSLDRIDNKKGYTANNCRFVCLGFNMLKGTGTDRLAFRIAKRIVPLTKDKP